MSADRAALVRVIPPADEPIALPEAKLHLRVDHAADDALIERYITAAREQLESDTSRALLTSTWELHLPAFPCSDRIALPRPPLQAVESITYRDHTGAVVTLSPSAYVVSTVREPGLVVLGYGQSWPSFTPYPIDAVTVRYTAGHGDTAAAVPAHLRLALRLLLGHFYENREATGSARVIPLGYDELIASDRMWTA